MPTNRRDFLKIAASAALTGVVGPGTAESSVARQPAENAMGVLVDMPKCIGCRRCEFACQDAQGLNPPPIDTFGDRSIMATTRRPGPGSYTVVNQYPNPGDAERPLYAKVNCLHCVDPACVSACLVGAMKKSAEGPVLYDAGRCMGCRYCMDACRYEVPAYAYENALTPQVSKCNLCAHLIPGQQEAPSCVKMCPEEALTYGNRAELLELAHEKIRRYPDQYVDHVYGEHEAGGTSWLFLSSIPFEDVGMWEVDHKAPPRLTESIQHGVFKHFGPPLMLYGILGAIMHVTKPKKNQSEFSPEVAESGAMTSAGEEER